MAHGGGGRATFSAMRGAGVGRLGLGATFGATFALLAGPGAATASTLSASEAVPRACEERLLAPADPASDRTTWRAPATGHLTAALDGGRSPDWDLALFRASDRAPIAASTSFTSAERASTWIERDDEIVVQACRRSGEPESVPLTLDFWAGEPDLGQDERLAMVSVTIGDGNDLLRLQRLGVDVTHDIEPGSATVMTYSDEERAKLRQAGFDFFPLIRDVAASDASDRAAEASAAATGNRSTLPSGRETYRTPSDYTTEMKALADNNPALVRSIVIGQTLEGRPIEGVEIAADVNSSDDGRPIFLNFGAHHAREWPSAEMPMEFALELVARWDANDPRVRSLLQRVRVIIVPIVNVDGFTASRSFGYVPVVDDEELLTIGPIATGSGSYRRKNCRPMAGEVQPCAARTSGVDLNRNYGAYWGGPGASGDPTSQQYRGAGPFSEPESAAVHDFTSKLHPMVLISNHTVTEGSWLRQPGFDADFLPQIEVPRYAEDCAKNPTDDGTLPEDPGAITPDEAAMKDLGDDMAAASEPDWISELGYETLCDITGATEDWNYFSQGTYGYTPELKGTNFHANYSQMVVTEYGTAPGVGVREAYLIAAERAADPAHHSIIQGSAPPGATLTLRKDFETPTCESAACPLGNGPPIQDSLRTRLTVPARGNYTWHVTPSGRPMFPSERWTMSCQIAGGPLVTRQVAVARGQAVTENFAQECALGGAEGGGGASEQRHTCARRAATVVGTSGNDRLKGTKGNDVIVAGRGNDKVKGKQGKDRICGRGGRDRIAGGGGKDRLRGGGGPDRIRGGGGKDRCKGGRGKDKLASCR